jgi:hypothetical protein
MMTGTITLAILCLQAMSSLRGRAAVWRSQSSNSAILALATPIRLSAAP